MVKIRLRRMGAKKSPYYRIIVADSKAPRDGRFIEEIGVYNPLTSPSEIKIDLERANYWIKNGAQPTDTVRALLKKSGASLKEKKIKIAVEKAAPKAKAKAEPEAKKELKAEPKVKAAPEAKEEAAKEPEAEAVEATVEDKEEKADE